MLVKKLLQLREIQRRKVSLLKLWQKDTADKGGTNAADSEVLHYPPANFFSLKNSKTFITFDAKGVLRWFFFIKKLYGHGGHDATNHYS